MLEIGSILDGKYKILNEVGHGGMSVVYLAINERANKTWAVKEVRKDGGNDSEVVSQGLVAETEMLKKLNHPNLPAIIDVIDRDDSFIIVMDYIEGKSLQSVLNHKGAQPVDDVVEWAKQLCDVLGYLHSRRPPIIYRDMKPSNVMLQPDGKVTLIDFGTAREYKQHSQGDTTWLGTRGYAAPEQFGGRGQTDARTDIYCLGATMYHLLTGYSPADTQFVIYPLGQLRPEFSGSGIEKIVAKCCEPDAVNRYQSCAELMYALEHVHDQDYVAIRERNRKWYAFLAAAIVAAVGAAGTIGFSLAEKGAIDTSYTTYISQANGTSDIAEAAKYYTRAMNLQPEKSAAYNQFVRALHDDGVITQEDKLLLENGLNSSRDTGAGTESNIETFRKSNPHEYAEFEYDLGFAYYDYYQNGIKDANTSFTSALESEGLQEEKKRAIAETMRTITDYYVNLAQIQQSQSWTQDNTEAEYNYGDFWKKLMEVAGNPAEVDENTGGRTHSIAMYREIATQISTNLNKYAEAGVTQEEMTRALNAAQQYLAANGGAQNDNAGTLELINQANTALEDAGSVLATYYKTVGGGATEGQMSDETSAADPQTGQLP